MKNTKMKYLKTRFFYAFLLVVSLGTLNVFADDGDPFAPPVDDPANVEIIKLLPIVLIIGIFYAYTKMVANEKKK